MRIIDISVPFVNAIWTLSLRKVTLHSSLAVNSLLAVASGYQVRASGVILQDLKLLWNPFAGHETFRKQTSNWWFIQIWTSVWGIFPISRSKAVKTAVLVVSYLVYFVSYWQTVHTVQRCLFVLTLLSLWSLVRPFQESIYVCTIIR